MTTRSSPFPRPRPPGGDLSADRVAGLIRARFGLATAAAVVVTELACPSPGCPPLETVIAFWADDGARYRITFFKPLAEVVDNDLPPRWLKPAYIDDGEGGCC